ncbi:hypothetical protein QOZ80_2AG0113020 [Eleusine coracana subsp. coracana]|nr:hypothetical protein QOZ80_2AG0113020 [Eleusine coracana subsp. coracana]
MQMMHKKKEYKYAFIDDNDINGLTPDLMAPWDPYFLEPPADANLDPDSNTKLVMKWANKKAILLRKYGATAIMFPDITPKVTNDNFYTTMNVLLPILRKDCPRSFRNFFGKYGGWIVWRSMIIPEALNYLITQNAVKCTRVVLEGKAPELQGIRANPNWMNQGYSDWGLTPTPCCS